MSIVSCEKTENCFSDSQTYTYTLGFRIGEDFLSYLEPHGEMEVKRNFRRPFFIMGLPDGTVLRGALGDDRLKASFPNRDVESTKAGFESLLAAFGGEEGGKP